jgi:catechol 2,3-dioxygenase-like lactoylglutathione lyase family enzyme
LEAIISKMVKDFEEGRLSRRELVKSVALAAVFFPGSATAATTLADGAFKTISLDHISYQVADYRKTRDFYSDLTGMNVRVDNGTSQAVLEFGDSLLIARNHRERPGEPPPSERAARVDHIAYKIDAWDTDKVKAELERRGLTPRLDKGGDTPHYVSFHVEDPDGFDLQISGIAQPGDSEYEKSDQ